MENNIDSVESNREPEPVVVSKLNKKTCQAVLYLHKAQFVGGIIAENEVGFQI